VSERAYATEDYLPSIGCDGGDVFGGLTYSETEDDYTGEAAGARWCEPPRLDTDSISDGVRLRTPRQDSVESAQAVQDLLNSGHGFLVRTVTRDESNLTPRMCRYCGGPLPLPESEWFCELEYFDQATPMPGCECNWCENRREWESGQSRSVGRPREICDSPECKRQQRNERQRRYRARRRELASV